MPTQIISYNVNGIRAAMRKGFTDWVQEGGYDMLCIQETKSHEHQAETDSLSDMGYHQYWHSAEKKGYSGVALFTKRQPDQVIYGCGEDLYDREGRIMRADFGDWTLLNCYFPSGTTGDVRQSFKMEFLEFFRNWIDALRKNRPKLIIVGDYNIAHTELDIHDPVRNVKTSGFLPEEREWLTAWFESGFSDAFRKRHPDEVSYSWWTYRAGARARNKGWRIDYQSVSTPLVNSLLDAGQLSDAVHSDHCPVWALYSL